MASSLDGFFLHWNDHHNTLVSVLRSLLQREIFVDVVLAAEGQFIKVHSVVLCMCSQYFEDLLSQQTDKQAIVFLKDVTFTDLRVLVDFMYSGQVIVSQDRLATLIQTAEALKIRGLLDNDHVRGHSSSHSSKLKSKSQSKQTRTAQEKAPPPPVPHHGPAQPAKTKRRTVRMRRTAWDVKSAASAASVKPAQTVADVHSAASEDVTEMPVPVTDVSDIDTDEEVAFQQAIDEFYRGHETSNSTDLKCPRCQRTFWFETTLRFHVSHTCGANPRIIISFPPLSAADNGGALPPP